MFSFNTTVKSGLVALAILIAMLSIRIASANTDADWAIHHDVSQATVTLINLDGYQIEYWAGECVLRLDSSFTKTIDTLTVRVANAIPAYDILYYPAKVTSCVTRN